MHLHQTAASVVVYCKTVYWIPQQTFCVKTVNRLKDAQDYITACEDQVQDKNRQVQTSYPKTCSARRAAKQE